MKPNPDAVPAAPRKPRLALAIATCLGAGYIPKAPGSFGSILGILAATFSQWSLRVVWFALPGFGVGTMRVSGKLLDAYLFLQFVLGLSIASAGVWSAGRASKYLRDPDPQQVTVDEVSGQQLTLFLGGFGPGRGSDSYQWWAGHPLGFANSVFTNWKYLLLGFILFRVFDIWKPFPVRQAEKLPGGWGIMADDWVAAVYAALGLWVARYLGL